jgi:hypothetical protein
MSNALGMLGIVVNEASCLLEVDSARARAHRLGRTSATFLHFRRAGRSSGRDVAPIRPRPELVAASVQAPDRLACRIAAVSKGAKR